ncbi:MAG: hypothetical protein KF774_21615 [Planctomyces sp.]|nr:hypothetical protein [Planctomyces sp.]
MTTVEIEEFAEILIQHARDPAVCASDMLFKSRGPTGKRWRASALGGSPEAFAKAIVPDIVDRVMFYLLHAIDDGLLKLSFTASNGKTVDLATETDGLAGWYMGSEGWRASYAKERFVDDFADLK